MSYVINNLIHYFIDEYFKPGFLEGKGYGIICVGVQESYTSFSVPFQNFEPVS